MMFQRNYVNHYVKEEEFKNHLNKCSQFIKPFRFFVKIFQKFEIRLLYSGGFILYGGVSLHSKLRRLGL